MEDRKSCHECIHKDVCSIRETLQRCIRGIQTDSLASFHDGWKFLDSLPDYCQYFMWGKMKEK